MLLSVFGFWVPRVAVVRPAGAGSAGTRTIFTLAPIVLLATVGVIALLTAVLLVVDQDGGRVTPWSSASSVWPAWPSPR